MLELKLIFISLFINFGCLITYTYGNYGEPSQIAYEIETLSNTEDFSPAEVTEILIKHGNNPKKWDPLYYSIYVHDYRAAILLLDYSENINKLHLVKDNYNRRQNTPLDLLIENFGKGAKKQDQEKLIIKMLNKGANLWHLGTCEGPRPWIPKIPKGSPSFASLSAALRYNASDELVNWLLDKVDDINLLTSYLLIPAIRSGNVKNLKKLLSLGLNPQTLDADKQYPYERYPLLHSAVESPSMDMLKFVVEEMDIPITQQIEKFGNPLCSCVKRYDVEHLAYLLSIGIDPNYYEKKHHGIYQNPPLNMAFKLNGNSKITREKKKKIITLLIQYGGKF